MGVSCCPTSCSVTLSLRDGKSSNVPRCLLAAASPVLNEVLSLPLATPGVLELPDDDPVAWEAVLRVLVPSPVLDMANWVGAWLRWCWQLLVLWGRGHDLLGVV